MALPAQIQKQAEEVAKFEEQVAAQSAPPTQQEPVQTDAPATTETQSQSPAPAPVQEPPKPSENDIWKQRFQSLQGMYNSQIPQLQQQIKELQAQLEARPVPPKAEAPAQSAEPLVTKSDVEAFGDDLIDVARRIAREEFSRLAGQYEGKISALESQLADANKNVGKVAEVQAMSGRDRFFDQLNTRLPRWQELQETPECQTWLGTRMPGTQVTWNDVLVAAADRLDVDSVVEVFDQFKRQSGKSDAPSQAATQKARTELERQVAPSKTGAQASSAPADRRIYSGMDYQSESMRVVRLAQQGKHEEAARLEAELNAALAEGRVTP